MNISSKYIFISLLAATIFYACSENRESDSTIENKIKPNFIFILVDDLGWTDLGYSGSTFYETPNIDSLSLFSIQFTNAYSTGSVCSPSRASIMTGKHPTRLNITDWIPGNDGD